MGNAEFIRQLVLENLVVESVKEECDQISVFCSTNGKERPAECPYCHCKSLDVHKTTQKRVLDVPYHHKKVSIIFPYRRYRCRDCKKIIGAQFDLIDLRSGRTIRLERRIATDCLYYSFHNVASRYFLTEPAVLSLFNKYISQQPPMAVPKHLGIEPITIEKHTYGLILNVFTGKPVELSASYSSEDISAALDHLYPADSPNRICMNFGDEHIQELRNRFPNAILYYNPESVYRTMLQFLTETCPEASKNRKMVELLTMPGKSLQDYQNRKLQSFFRKHREIEDLYFLKESFYESLTEKEWLDEWYDHVQSSAYSSLGIDRDLLRNYTGMEINYPFMLPGHGYSFETLKSLVIYQAR